MTQHVENITGVTMRKITSDHQQNVISFRSSFDCTEDGLAEIYKTIVGKILCGRDVIVVTKEDQLMDLISDVVETNDQRYLTDNALKVASFIPLPESSVNHNATRVKNFPFSVAKDLATSSEFIYGNLWFQISPTDADMNNEHTENLINDIHKLTPSAFSELPVLVHETVAAPAMYDGLEILWFKPNEDVYQNVIKPLFEK